MINLNKEYDIHKVEIDAAISKVLKRGEFIQGKEVTDFENLFSANFNVENTISCANGTDALQIALMAIGITPGDEIIVPAYAYISVVEVIVLLGAIPVFVDIDEYYAIKADDIEDVITERTKAIIIVHLYGQCGNLDQVVEIAKKHSLYLVEDTAQSLGSSYHTNGISNFLGLFGDIGCTSFFPTKNLGCYGDGGALYTNNSELAYKARIIASHGQTKKYIHNVVGINSRLDALQAAILNVKIKYLSEKQAKKNALVNAYNLHLKQFSEIVLPFINPNCEISWHQYTIQVLNNNRDKLKKFLEINGVSSMIYYPLIIPDQEAYKKFVKNGHFPKSLQASTNVLSLPIDPYLNLEQIHYITSIIAKFYERL